MYEFSCCLLLYFCMNCYEKSDVEIDGWQQQIILGTTLGSSCLVMPKNGKNAYLSMRVSKRQDINLLLWKAEALQVIARKHSMIADADSWHWNSTSHPALSTLYEPDFYNSPISVVRWLDQIRDVGLATFFLDKGRVEKQNIVLKLNRFGDEVTRTICQYFCDMQIPGQLDNKKLLLTDKGSQTFLRIVAPCVPERLYYKLLDRPTK